MPSSPSATPKKTRAKSTKPRSAAQIATQFKPGQAPVSSGASFRKRTRAFRERCDLIMSTVGLDVITSMLYDNYEKGDIKEVMDLLKWVALNAYGHPREMATIEEEDNPINQVRPLIVASREDLAKAIASNEEHETDE